MCILLKSLPGALDVVEGNLQRPNEFDKSVEQTNKAKYDSYLASFMKANSNALLVITTNMTERKYLKKL